MSSFQPWPVTVHYDDGSKILVRNEAGWRESPPTGVVAVSWPCQVHNVDYCYGRSYYFIAPTGWEYAHRPVSGDAGGLLDYLHTIGIDRSPESLTVPELRSLGIKLGRMVSNSTYATIIKPLTRGLPRHTKQRIHEPERNLV